MSEKGTKKKPGVPKTDVGNVSLKLSLKDRLIIRNLFPEKASLTNQIITRDIDRKVEVSQKEMKAVNLEQTPGGGIRWDEKKDKGKDVKFTEAEVTFMKDRIKEADEKELITLDMVDFCKMIKEL